jgi:predicted Zn-ribbon and HTH transcriptional regulator
MLFGVAIFFGCIVAAPAAPAVAGFAVTQASYAWSGLSFAVLAAYQHAFWSMFAPMMFTATAFLAGSSAWLYSNSVALYAAGKQKFSIIRHGFAGLWSQRSWRQMASDPFCWLFLGIAVATLVLIVNRAHKAWSRRKQRHHEGVETLALGGVLYAFVVPLGRAILMVVGVAKALDYMLAATEHSDAVAIRRLESYSDSLVDEGTVAPLAWHEELSDWMYRNVASKKNLRRALLVATVALVLYVFYKREGKQSKIHEAANWPRPSATVSSAVVILLRYDPEEDCHHFVSHGTCVNNCVLTQDHEIDPSALYEFTTDGIKYAGAVIRKRFPENDICIWTKPTVLKGHSKAGLRSLPLSSVAQTVTVGQRVTHVHFVDVPRDFSQVINTNTEVSSVEQKGDAAEIGCRNSTAPGDCGSPVVDSVGTLLGVHVAGSTTKGLQYWVTLGHQVRAYLATADCGRNVGSRISLPDEPASQPIKAQETAEAVTIRELEARLRQLEKKGKGKNVYDNDDFVPKSQRRHKGGFSGEAAATTGACRKCGKPGHFHDVCPMSWCPVCRQKGHMPSKCPLIQEVRESSRPKAGGVATATVITTPLQPTKQPQSLSATIEQ